MFKIKPAPTFWAPALIHVPGQGTGKLDIEFRYLDHEQRKAYSDSLPNKTNLEALTEIVRDWREADVAFSPQKLEELLNDYPTATQGLFDAFWDEIYKAPVKN